MVTKLSVFQAAIICFFIGWKMLNHGVGPQKWKYKKCQFFDFVLKVMVCFNLEMFEVFGKNLEHIIKSAKE